MNAGASTHAVPSPIEGSGTAWVLLGSWALSPARPTPIHPRRERRGLSALLVRQWVVSYPPRCSTSSLRVAAERGRPLAHTSPALRGGLPWRRSVVLKNVASHLLVALRGMNIVTEFLGFLRPDNRINLKESRILGIPLAAHHLPILRKVLASAFTLGDPLHDGWQRVLLGEDDTGLLHDLRQGAGRFPRRQSLAQHNTD